MRRIIFINFKHILITLKENENLIYIYIYTDELKIIFLNTIYTTDYVVDSFVHKSGIVWISII